MTFWEDNNDFYDDFEGYGSDGLDSEFNCDEPRFSEGPLLASTAHPQVRDVLNTEDLAGRHLGKAMIEAINIQMKLHAEQDAKYRSVIDGPDEDIALSITQPGSGDGKDNVLSSATQAGTGGEDQQPKTLFSHAAVRVAIELGRASGKEARAIAKRVPHVASAEFKNIVWKLPRLPYTVFHQAAQNVSVMKTVQNPTKASEVVELSQRPGAIDGWIIRNEKYMRARLVLYQPHQDGSTASPAGAQESSSLSQLGMDNSVSHWKEFMVGLGRDAQKVFLCGNEAHESAASTITIKRPQKADLPGLLLLDHHRTDTIKINTLAAFQSAFESMTFGALKGLNWKNVLVAGGIT